MAWRKPDLGTYEAIEMGDLLEALAVAKVGDFLGAKIPAVSPAASVRELLYRMITEKQSAYVVWKNKPHGIVTYQDALLGFASGKSAKATKVSEIVGQDGVYAVSPGTRALPLLLWMIKNAIPMVVVFEGDEFLGVFSTTSAFEHFSKLLKTATH